MFDVYGRKSCTYTKKACQCLHTRKYPFTYHDIAEDKNKETEMLRRLETPWNKLVPQIFWGNSHIGGYDDLVNFLG